MSLEVEGVFRGIPFELQVDSHTLHCSALRRARQRMPHGEVEFAPICRRERGRQDIGKTILPRGEVQVEALLHKRMITSQGDWVAGPWTPTERRIQSLDWSTKDGVF